MIGGSLMQDMGVFCTHSVILEMLCNPLKNIGGALALPATPLPTPLHKYMHLLHTMHEYFSAKHYYPVHAMHSGVK